MLDLCFTYVLSGWEGSVANGKLWMDAHCNDPTMPLGWFYLGNAGFPLTEELQTLRMSIQKSEFEI
jgi:hypothetical protein